MNVSSAKPPAKKGATLAMAPGERFELRLTAKLELVPGDVLEVMTEYVNFQDEVDGTPVLKGELVGTTHSLEVPEPE